MDIQQQQLTWNQFQKLNKGKWTKQEMSTRWATYKQQHQVKNIQQPQRSGPSSQRTIKAWIGSNNPVAAGDACQEPADQNTQQAPVAAPYIADDAQSTPQRQCQKVVRDYAAQSYSPVSAVTPSSTTSCAVMFHLQHSPSAATASSPASCKEQHAAAASPDTSDVGPSTAELAQLRAAVYHMLADQQTENFGTSGSAITAVGCDSVDVVGSVLANNQQWPQPPETSLGCFNLTASSRSKITWNGFQKLCKGRGLTKAEMSAAWQQHKHTGQLPEYTAQKADTTHMQQHKLSSIAGRWTGLKEWVQSRVASRANSRAVSRAASRAGSRATSPNSSPAPLGKIQLYRQQQQRRQSMQQVPDEVAWPQAAVMACANQAMQPAANSIPTDYIEQQQDLLELQLQEAQAAQEAAAAIAMQEQQQQAAASSCQASNISSVFVSSAAVTVTDTICGRHIRECVNDDDELLQGFGPWVPVSLQPNQLKQLKKMIPAKAGLYEWGARLPLGLHTTAGPDTTGATGSHAAGPSGAQAPTGLGPVVCFYLGKAGSLRTGRLAAAALGHRGEMLRTRFNKYALTKVGRLGPVREPHKDALFEQLQAAGAQLCYRWWVASDAEPRDMERNLLQKLDYAANVLLNGKRRPLHLYGAGST